MVARNEKVLWRGSPNRFAAAMNPSLILGAVLLAASLHPAVTEAIHRASSTLGLDVGLARLTSLSPALLIGSWLAWSYLLETTTVYLLTADRLVIRHGLFLRVEDEVELYRVIDAIQAVNVFQRMIGVGTVVVTSSDHTGTVTMRSINESAKVRNGLRKLAERCKSRRGVRILE